MSVLELRVDRKAKSPGLNPGEVIKELIKRFPEATVCPEDKLACSVGRAEHLGADNRVLQSLKRNAERNGPQFSFELSFSDENVVKGYVQKQVIVFLHEKPLSHDVEHRLLTFLKSFGLGVVKKTNATGQAESPN
jgi:hypothetical protein